MYMSIQYVDVCVCACPSLDPSLFLLFFFFPSRSSFSRSSFLSVSHTLSCCTHPCTYIHAVHPSYTCMVTAWGCLSIYDKDELTLLGVAFSSLATVTGHTSVVNDPSLLFALCNCRWFPGCEANRLDRATKRRRR